MKMNTPNKLTILRVIMIPFFVVAMMIPLANGTNKWIALAIFVIASATDWLDGYLARRDNLVTNFGKFMDPLADKLLVGAAMICMVALNTLPAWIVIVIISREFIISGLRLIAADNGIVIAASWWGKIKTATQMVMIIIVIAKLGGTFDIIEQVLIYASLILTVISLVDYIVKNKKVFMLQD